MRTIFASYLALGTVSALKPSWRSGIRVPERRDGKGERSEAVVHPRPSVQDPRQPDLRRPAQAQGPVHEGQHAGIVDPAIFDAVQAQLAPITTPTPPGGGRARICSPGASGTSAGTMTPSHTAKGSRRYRYYVSRAVLRGRPPARSVASRPTRSRLSWSRHCARCTRRPVSLIRLGPRSSATPSSLQVTSGR